MRCLDRGGRKHAPASNKNAPQPEPPKNHQKDRARFSLRERQYRVFLFDHRCSGKNFTLISPAASVCPQLAPCLAYLTNSNSPSLASIQVASETDRHAGRLPRPCLYWNAQVPPQQVHVGSSFPLHTNHGRWIGSREWSDLLGILPAVSA